VDVPSQQIAVENRHEPVCGRLLERDSSKTTRNSWWVITAKWEIRSRWKRALPCFAKSS
jgi:hypothetical protein